MRAAALVCLAAAAVLYLPSVVDRARRNKRVRESSRRAAECHAWFWRESSDPVEAWVGEETPIHDRLACEQMESQFKGGAA